MNPLKKSGFIAATIFLMFFIACGGGGGSNNPPQPQTYTVTFISTGGSPGAPSAQVSPGGTVYAPATTPTRTGYDFDGLYSNSAMTVRVTFPYTVNGNTMTAPGSAKFNSADTRYHGTGKTDAQLKQQSTYSGTIIGDGVGGLGWKFGNDDDNPWKMPSGGGYPILYWQ